MWERTQQQLQEHRVRAKSHAASLEKSPLTGRLVDENGDWAYAQSRTQRREKIPLLRLAQLPGPRTGAVARRLALACAENSKLASRPRSGKCSMTSQQCLRLLRKLTLAPARSTAYSTPREAGVSAFKQKQNRPPR